MSRLSVVSGKEVIKALTIPDHKEIARGTLRTIIREAGLTVEEFRQLLK